MIFALAVAIDWLFGDPPNAFHPVAWFGKFVSAIERRAPHARPRDELLFGAGIAVSGIAIAAAPTILIEKLLRGRGIFGGFALAALLKMTFAWRTLIESGEKVRHDLESDQADAARTELRALVSRDTATLGSSHLAAASIESLAENASDSFIAPLFYYHLFGLPGAFAYRAVNTMDSMLGYHGRYEYLGKIPARFDDAMNFIPARITALLIVIAARSRRAWRVTRRDHALTASPNAGYPMSAMAGALDVHLEKVDHYRLNESARAPEPHDIRRAARIVTVALGMVTVIAVGVSVARRR